MRFDLGPIEALESTSLPGGTPLLLAVDSIDEDPAQPRMEFDPGALQELADTIKARGVRQPISVRPHPGQPERWMLNFGSRRLRASKLAGNREIPAFVDLTVDSPCRLPVLVACTSLAPPPDFRATSWSLQRPWALSSRPASATNRRGYVRCASAVARSGRPFFAAARSAGRRASLRSRSSPMVVSNRSADRCCLASDPSRGL